MINNSAQSPAPRRTPHLFEIRVLRTIPKIPREEHSTIPSKIILGVPLMDEHTSFTVNVFWSSFGFADELLGWQSGSLCAPQRVLPRCQHPARPWHIRHNPGIDGGTSQSPGSFRICVCPVLASCPFSVPGSHPGYRVTSRRPSSLGSCDLWRFP